MGDSVTVCAKVYGVKTTNSITFINLGSAYPHAPLTVVIFTKDIANFKVAPYDLYNEKRICVSGKLIEYKGKPEIIITGPDQVSIDK
jgi:micrococcal nuclease